MRRSPLRRLAAAAAAAAAGLLAGLVSGCDRQPTAPASTSTLPDAVTVTPGPDGVQTVEVQTGDDHRFHPAQITATVGPIRLTLRHLGTGAPHDWLAAGIPGAQVPLVHGGESRSVQFTASHPADYRFVCTIHEAQGQVGRLVVRPH